MVQTIHCMGTVPRTSAGRRQVDAVAPGTMNGAPFRRPNANSGLRLLLLLVVRILIQSSLARVSLVRIQLFASMLCN